MSEASLKLRAAFKFIKGLEEMFVDVYFPLGGSRCSIAEMLIRDKGVGVELNDDRLKAAILRAKDKPCPVHDGGGGRGRREFVSAAARRPQEADVSRSQSDTESIPADTDGGHIKQSPIYSPAASLNAAAAFDADVSQRPESEDDASINASATSFNFPASTASASVTFNTSPTSASNPAAAVNMMRPRVVKTTPPPAEKQHKYVKSLQCDKEELYFTPPKAGVKIRFYFAWIDTPGDFFIILEENKIRLDGLTLDMYHFYQRSVTNFR